MHSAAVIPFDISDNTDFIANKHLFVGGKSAMFAMARIQSVAALNAATFLGKQGFG